MDIKYCRCSTGDCLTGRHQSLFSTMKHYLLLLLAGVCASAPVEQAVMETGSCTDPQAAMAANLALTKINEDRQEGYIFRLHRLANVNMMPNGETGWVFYLTIDVVETSCHVLSKKEWKNCEARPTHDTPVYGQCKASLYVNRPHRVVRLYKYQCTVRPVPASRVATLCPDCPTYISMDNAEIEKAASLSLEKFNKENGLANHFALLNITRATSQMGIAVFYNVEYTVQETTCAKTTEVTQVDKCPIMECEFAHKGHCKGSKSHNNGEEFITVECDIFEPEAAEKEKQLHLLGGETDHSHSDKHSAAVDQTHDGPHDAAGHDHDHVHDHTKSHQQHEKTELHAENSDHHHTHDHGHDSGPTHAHDHSHDHGHGHDHFHEHHAKAHDHSGDAPNQHHDYKHAADVHTHEHDHEHALDHDHKHGHLHNHEHHHHHHEHEHEPHVHHHPEGMVRVIPDVDQPATMPSFPDEPVGGPEVGVTLPLIPDPQIPGEKSPTIVPFPKAVGTNCPGQANEGADNELVKALFVEDALFKVAA